MTEKKKNPVDLTGLREMRAKTSASRRVNILDAIENMDEAAKKKTEDIPTLRRAKTEDILKMLARHKYKGWE